MGDTRASILSNMFSQTFSMDLVLRVEGDNREIKAHRSVLMGSSGYFHSMLNGDFQEGHLKEITLKEISFEALKMLVEFVYSGKLNFDKCTIRQATQTADYLNIGCAIKSLNDYLSMNITLENCIEIYGSFDFLRSVVGAKVESFIRKNLGVRPHIKNLFSLNLDQVVKILKNPTPVDRILFDLVIVIHWVLTSPGTRSNFVAKLLPLVVFTTKPKLDYLYKDLLPICKCVHSKDFFIALLMKCNGADTEFTRKFFNEKNWKC